MFKKEKGRGFKYFIAELLFSLYLNMISKKKVNKRSQIRWIRNTPWSFSLKFKEKLRALTSF